MSQDLRVDGQADSRAFIPAVGGPTSIPQQLAQDPTQLAQPMDRGRLEQQHFHQQQLQQQQQQQMQMEVQQLRAHQLQQQQQPQHPGRSSQSLHSSNGLVDESRNDSPASSKRRSNRTGQACDRCKLRKIKCNATTGACTPCTLARVSCTNTDLNSRRAVPRGYVELLENQISSLKARVEELESVLKGIVPSIDISNLLRPDQIDILRQLQSPTVLPSIEALTSLKLSVNSTGDQKFDGNRPQIKQDIVACKTRQEGY